MNNLWNNLYFFRGFRCKSCFHRKFLSPISKSDQYWKSVLQIRRVKLHNFQFWTSLLRHPSNWGSRDMPWNTQSHLPCWISTCTYNWRLPSLVPHTAHSYTKCPLSFVYVEEHFVHREHSLTPGVGRLHIWELVSVLTSRFEIFRTYVCALNMGRNVINGTFRRASHFCISERTFMGSVRTLILVLSDHGHEEGTSATELGKNKGTALLLLIFQASCSWHLELAPCS